MSQYVIQIQIEENGLGVGWLAKSFKVAEDAPIPESWPDNRVQVVMTNTESFSGENGIVATYAKYKWPDVKFSHDEINEKINCTGAVTRSWPIN